MDKERLFDWIKLDEQQLQWLINYLSSRIPTSKYTQLPYSPITIEEIIHDICMAKTNDSLVLFITKTKAAWNQFQRRVKRKKSYVTSTLEIKKDIYKNAVEIAKKYKIPTNVAIEELVKKGCELEKEYIKEERLRKQVPSLKSDIFKKRQSRLSELNINQRKLISVEDIHKKLTLEMYDKHCLEIQLINLATEKSTTSIKEEITRARQSYARDCQKYGVNNLDANTNSQ